ncbi:MAG: hypothetical protein GXP25_18960 [Planctomycetes bacterium]|nr:hypothetical protein [Planctomycetota bacterium]
MTLAFWLRVHDTTGTWQFPVGKYQGNIRRNYGIYLTIDDAAPFPRVLSPEKVAELAR